MIEQAYDNIKKKSKKVAAADKMERFKTGGGSYCPQVDTVDEKVLLLLGNRATPLVNQFDSDCFYQCDSEWGLYFMFSLLVSSLKK